MIGWLPEDIQLHAGYYTEKNWIPLPFKIRKNFYLGIFSDVKKERMLPGNFLGFALNGKGGILLVPFSRSANQFQKVFAPPYSPTGSLNINKQLESLRREQQATQGVILKEFKQVGVAQQDVSQKLEDSLKDLQRNNDYLIEKVDGIGVSQQDVS